MKQLAVRGLEQRARLDSGVDTFDLAIGYVNDDERSIENLRAVSAEMAPTRIAYLAKISPSDAPESDSRFGREECLDSLHGFRCLEWTETSGREVAAFLYDAAIKSGDSKVSCYLDVSAMPRSLAASILVTLRLLAEVNIEVRLTLGYCLAEYTAPSQAAMPPNRRVSPVHDLLAGWTQDPSSPVQVLVGLGYERGKALGAVEYLQPSDWRLFLPESPEERFFTDVQTQNAELLEGTKDAHKFEYNVLDPAFQFVTMHSMIRAMIVDTRPVFLPFGPKIFFAVCVLLGLMFPSVAVWHVSGEEQAMPSKRKPSEHRVQFSLSLLCVELDEPKDDNSFTSAIKHFLTVSSHGNIHSPSDG